MSTPTPYVARVERVFHSRNGRYVEIKCPFLCDQGTHVHPWRRGDEHPSRETLAPCAQLGELRTYAIDPGTAAAKQNAANAGKNVRSQFKGRKS